jgi:uncharacterized protein YyaL (SSP411 family)
MSSPLENSTSPYLRAHKDNPVQWRVWGPEVLVEAAAQDKPILLSIGYVGCDWCTAMNRESFSDPSLAALINDHYIPVLADRAERPDLDLIYQGAAGAMGHEGGWPLNVFLNPQGEPFWVTTHLPVEDTGGVPSFRRVLTDTALLYRNDRAKADKTGANVRAALNNLYNRNMASAQENMNLDVAAMRVAQRFDIFFGGLLATRKFLHPLMLELMWRAYLRSGATQFSQTIFTTLDAILFGGAYDHVGGGFFRHSQDERWMEPSFEKTLYDNAGMIEVCTQVWQFNRNELCRQRVAETVDWLLRDMKVGNGFAALIASDDEESRAYYLWSEAEIDAALVGTFSARFKQVYGITRDGNLQGRNLPRRLGNPPPANEADEALLARQREMLLAARAKRKLPPRDDRLLADWNGLAIAALARAGQVFEKPEWIEAAVAAFDEVVARLDDNGRLSHVAGIKGFADDYANMARAALQLWEVTREERFLTQAKTWNRVMDEHFWSQAQGGYFYYADDAESLFVRPRMLFENPAPSANGTMLMVLTRLALITGDPDYMTRGSILAATFGDEANRIVNGSATFFIGFEYLVNSLTVLVVGPKDDPRTKDLLRAYWGKPTPNGLLVQMEPDAALPAGHPATGRGMEAGMPTAYICQAGACSEGYTSAVTLSDALTLPPQLRQQQTV